MIEERHSVNLKEGVSRKGAKIKKKAQRFFSAVFASPLRLCVKKPLPVHDSQIQVDRKKQSKN